MGGWKKNEGAKKVFQNIYFSYALKVSVNGVTCVTGS